MTTEPTGDAAAEAAVNETSEYNAEEMVVDLVRSIVETVVKRHAPDPGETASAPAGPSGSVEESASNIVNAENNRVAGNMTPVAATTTAAADGMDRSALPAAVESVSAAASPSREGLQLGDWNVDLNERIGRGSYANVWKATRFGATEGAVKEVLVSELSDKLVESLESEVSILKKVTHPNIVSLFDIYKRPGRMYLVLEYCGGGDLHSFLRRNQRLKEHTVRRFMSHLSSGLGAMRQLSLVHRDLKPQNLLLTSRDGTDAVLKIGDFGFARYIQPHGMAETLCGSPLYMAPEILMMNKYDAKADLWSVGAIMFEMLVGRPPFTGNNHLELLRNIEKSTSQGGGWQLPAKVSYACSSKCKALLRGLLQRKPVNRISYEELFTHPFLGNNQDPGSSSGSGDIVRDTTSSTHSREPMRMSTSVPSGAESDNADARDSCEKAPSTSTSHRPELPRVFDQNATTSTRPERRPSEEFIVGARQDHGRNRSATLSAYPTQAASSAERERDGIKRRGTEMLFKVTPTDAVLPSFGGPPSNDSGSHGSRRSIASTELLGDYVVVDEEFDAASEAGTEGDVPISSVLGFPAALSAEPGVGGVADVLCEADALSVEGLSSGAGLTSSPQVNAADSLTARLASLEAAGVALSEAVVPTTMSNAISTAHAEVSLSLFAAEVINAAMALARGLPHGQGEPRRRRLRADLEAALNRARAAGRRLAGSDEVHNASVLPNQIAVAYDAALGFIRQGAVEELVGGDRNQVDCGVNATAGAAPRIANASYAKAEAILRVLRDEAPSMPLAPPFRPDDNDRALLSKHISNLCVATCDSRQ